MLDSSICIYWYTRKLILYFINSHDMWSIRSYTHYWTNFRLIKLIIYKRIQRVCLYIPNSRNVVCLKIFVEFFFCVMYNQRANNIESYYVLISINIYHYSTGHIIIQLKVKSNSKSKYNPFQYLLEPRSYLLLLLFTLRWIQSNIDYDKNNPIILTDDQMIWFLIKWFNF